MSEGSLSPVSVDDAASIAEAAPLTISQPGRVILWLMTALGLLVFILALNGADPRHAWMSFQINLMFWLMAAAAGTMWSSAFHICDAQWCRPVRRIFESMSCFLLLCVPLLAFMYIGHGSLFAWAHEPAAGKEAWLVGWFVYLRDVLALLLFAFLARRVVHLSIRRDIGAVRSGLTGASEAAVARWSDKKYNKFVGGWGNNPEQALRDTSREMWTLSPIVVVMFAVVMTLLAFDQIMSVDYHWFSTLFGALYFMSGVYLAYAFVGIGIGFLRDIHPLYLRKIERRTLHDHGKLLFGFGIFWAYMFWSHYLPIWYGNLPEETQWVIVRLRLEPWHSLAWVTFAASFIIPFWLGLSRDVKQMPVLLFCTGVIVAVGMWLQIYVLFAPTLYPNNIPIGLVDLFITLGFMGAFILTCVRFLEKYPLMPFGDLYVYEPGPYALEDREARE
ncbi:MAG: hypothetical protein KDD66_16215, partial [Bdellovibrionales bacterium]|nr:hypothetical protein [Bdellovibrionales bacterium]